MLIEEINEEHYPMNEDIQCEYCGEDSNYKAKGWKMSDDGSTIVCSEHDCWVSYYEDKEFAAIALIKIVELGEDTKEYWDWVANYHFEDNPSYK
tara:strand:- start:2911 stop:3192 length:282 start_codon:yes stop_codon:yes gene_type:complete